MPQHRLQRGEARATRDHEHRVRALGVLKLPRAALDLSK